MVFWASGSIEKHADLVGVALTLRRGHGVRELDFTAAAIHTVNGRGTRAFCVSRGNGEGWWTGLLIGRGHELQRHHMEIRGVGIIDIASLFGIRAIRLQKRTRSPRRPARRWTRSER
jgi:hypothetical protein